MSLRFRSELRLELRMRSCQVELLGRGWNPRPQAVANGTGSGVAALSAALQGLKLTELDSMPSVARLTVADEYVHHALLDTGSNTQQALEAARAHYAQALQRDDLRVQVMPLGRSGRWLAAAVIDTDLQAWRQTLEEAGVQLTHLHTALIEDLRELAPQIPEDDAVIALLREEGISLVRLKDGLPIALAWERLDTSMPQALDDRLRAFVRDAASLAGVGRQCVVYLLPESRALCRCVWDGRDLPGLLPLPQEAIGSNRMASPPPWPDTAQIPVEELAEQLRQASSPPARPAARAGTRS